MQHFYKMFFKWRRDAGMNNKIADDLQNLMAEIGLVSIQKINADKHYQGHRTDFNSKVGIGLTLQVLFKW